MMTPGNWFILCYEVNITLNVAGRRKDPEVDPSQGPGPAQEAGGEDLRVDTAGASLLGRGQLRGVAVAPGLPRKTMTSIPGDT